jgi:hypothetical protein
MRSPQALIGLVVGVVLGWAAVVLGSYAGTELYLRRVQRFDDQQSETLPWLLALVAIGLVLGGLMSIARFGSGVMAGVGLLMTVAGVVVQIVPIATAVDVIRVFELPGAQPRGGVLLLDGALVVVGVVLLVAGGRRMTADSRRQMPPYYLDSQAQPGLYPQQPGRHPQMPGQYPPPGRPGPQDRPH